MNCVIRRRVRCLGAAASAAVKCARARYGIRLCALQFNMGCVCECACVCRELRARAFDCDIRFREHVTRRERIRKMHIIKNRLCFESTNLHKNVFFVLRYFILLYTNNIYGRAMSVRMHVCICYFFLSFFSLV